MRNNQLHESRNRETIISNVILFEFYPFFKQRKNLLESKFFMTLFLLSCRIILMKSKWLVNKFFAECEKITFFFLFYFEINLFHLSGFSNSIGQGRCLEFCLESSVLQEKFLDRFSKFVLNLCLPCSKLLVFGVPPSRLSFFIAFAFLSQLHICLPQFMRIYFIYNGLVAQRQTALWHFISIYIRNRAYEMLMLMLIFVLCTK